MRLINNIKKTVSKKMIQIDIGNEMQKKVVETNMQTFSEQQVTAAEDIVNTMG
jgi:hypothetical protein